MDAELRRAARHGDVERLRALLRDGADPRAQAPAPSLASPLFCAAAGGSAACVRELLRHGADADVPARCGTTAVMAAARSGHAEALAALLEAGARVDAVRSGGDDALTLAIFYSQARCVELLVRAPGVDVNTPRAVMGQQHLSPLTRCVTQALLSEERDASTLRALLTSERLDWSTVNSIMCMWTGRRRRRMRAAALVLSRCNVLVACLELGWEEGFELLLAHRPQPQPDRRERQEGHFSLVYTLPCAGASPDNQQLHRWCPIEEHPSLRAFGPAHRRQLSLRIATSPLAAGELSQELSVLLLRTLGRLRPACVGWGRRSGPTLRNRLSTVLGVLAVLGDVELLDAYMSLQGPELWSAANVQMAGWAASSTTLGATEKRRLLAAMPPRSLPCTYALRAVEADASLTALMQRATAPLKALSELPTAKHGKKPQPYPLRELDDARMAAFISEMACEVPRDTGLRRVGYWQRPLVREALTRLLGRERRYAWVVLFSCASGAAPGVVGWVGRAPRRVSRTVVLLLS